MIEIPLPDKPVNQLTGPEMAIFRQWIGFEPGGAVVPYPTPEEETHRQKREAWKRRYAGRGALEPRLLIRPEQVQMAQANAGRNDEARRWLEATLAQAETAAALPADFFSTFIPEQGSWNPRGNFCPNCIGDKSPEGINRYFWDWDWREPDHLRCPYCGFVYPDARFPENGLLELPRMGQRYTFHILEAELESDGWRLGERAARYVYQPIHLSFSGNIRAMKIAWALAQVEPLSLAYAFTGREVYAKTVERILLRLAEVYPNYLLHSYFQDVVDADPGYATDQADALPTLFKRNACISVYDGRYGRGGETTTRTTRVATGLWGCSRIAPELSATAQTFLKLFQGYDLVKGAIEPETRRRIEADFLLEFYLDVRAYEPITNKAGPVRAARVAFGLVYEDEKEVEAGLDGFQRILESQFYADGSMKESPLYAHKPIGEDLWRIPEMLRGRIDLYGEGLYRAGLETFAALATPLGTQPPLDDCYHNIRISRRTVDIAAARGGIQIPNPGGPPSDFAILNTRLAKEIHLSRPGEALNRFYAGRRLACVGYGSGENRTQVYLLGEDGLKGHRHAGALNIQLYVGPWEVFPDIGYIWDHPGKQWGSATASHQTVVVDEQNAIPAGPSQLLGFVGQGPARFIDMTAPLVGDILLRRAITLIEKEDGWPILVDLFDVVGGKVHDYNVRADVPQQTASLTGPDQQPQTPFDVEGGQQHYQQQGASGRPNFSVRGPKLKPREQSLYQEHSYYPLLDFQTAGAVAGGWTAVWTRGDKQVRATILTPCSELITYRAPGWRSQLEIAAEPQKYFDTIVLRNQQAQGRFVVVYEVVQGPPQIEGAVLEDAGDQVTVRLDLSGGRTSEVQIPGTRQDHSETTWRYHLTV